MNYRIDEVSGLGFEDASQWEGYKKAKMAAHFGNMVAVNFVDDLNWAGFIDRIDDKLALGADEYASYHTLKNARDKIQRLGLKPAKWEAQPPIPWRQLRRDSWLPVLDDEL